MPKRPTTPSEPTMVLVVWRDAHGMYADWHDLYQPETDAPEYLVKTVGWFLPNRKKGHVVVALNLSEFHVGDGIAIPEAMVISITPLVKQRKKK